MRQILAPADSLRSLCRPQQSQKQKVYRFSSLCLRQSCEDGVLLYHSLTGELLLLSEGELRLIENGGGDREELIKKRFLVPVDFCDTDYVDQIRRVLTLMHKKSERIKHFTIFPTMDCNAHCFYCFENGRRRHPMSDETARDAVNYILRVSGGEPVTLNWFGGEPLYNRRAIEIILAGLRENNVEYRSTMVSNGYLFDPDTVREAVEEWKLNWIQITLDGTEEVYNRIKAYDWAESSPYRRVLRNIGLLLDAGIAVRIRLNLVPGNAEDLHALAEELAEQFPSREKLDVYAALVREDNGALPGWDWQEALAAYRELDNHLISLNLRKPKVLMHKLKLNHCQADDDGCVIILPGGELGKCEHYSDSEFIGSIFSEERDQECIASWKEKIDRVEACDICPCYPRCTFLKKCNWLSVCTELDREMRLDDLREQVLNAYRSSAVSENEEDEIRTDC